VVFGGLNVAEEAFEAETLVESLSADDLQSPWGVQQGVVKKQVISWEGRCCPTGRDKNPERDSG